MPYLQWSRNRALRVLQVAIVYVLACTACGEVHADDAGDVNEYVPGQLVVEYAAIVTDSAVRIVGNEGFGTFLEDAPVDEISGIQPGSTLDALHERVGLVDIRPAFLHATDETTTEARVRELEYYESILERFPERAARRDPAAQFPDRTNVYVLLNLA